MADVFISYARQTGSTARKIAEGLRSQGYSVWFDQELPAHRAYADVISEQLEEARAVVVVWSKEASASHWVRSEANRAREKGNLIQANIDGSRLPMPFDQFQYSDLRRWQGSLSAPGWQKLNRSIEELLNGQSARPHPKSAQSPRQSANGVGRRAILIGGGSAAAFGAIGMLAWRHLESGDVPPEAQVLVQKAQAITQDGRPAEFEQAVAYLLEATRLAPGYAVAWGMLAFSYAIRKFQAPVAARDGEEARCRSAARTALDLDGDQALATCALALLVPPYRNWRTVEETASRLARQFPDTPLATHLHANLLADVGRWNDAVRAYSTIDRSHFIALSHRNVIQALWSSGDLQGAERLLNESVQRWPRHPAIWLLRADFLTHSGRADEAVRLLDDPAARTLGFTDDFVSATQATARSISGALKRGAAVAANLAAVRSGSSDPVSYLNRKHSGAQIAAQRCAALGDTDSAFALLHGYYFGQGPWAGQAPAAGDQDRSTSPLFEPPMKNLWNDKRFAELTRRIGMHSYWQKTGKNPDFRSA